MSADTPGTIAIKDGTLTPQTELATFDGSQRFAFQRALRVNGAPVEAGNPLPTRVPSVAPVASGGVEAGHVLNAAACSVAAIQANTGASSGWVFLLDANAIPGDGTLSNIKKWWQVQANTTIDRTFSPPLSMALGAVLVFSTTGPMIKTASATAVFSGETF